MCLEQSAKVQNLLQIAVFVTCASACVRECNRDVRKVALGIWLEAMTESAKPCTLHPRRILGSATVNKCGSSCVQVSIGDTKFTFKQMQC